MKKYLLLTLMLMVKASSFAEKVEIDGLWYDIEPDTREAKVIKNNVYYTGNIEIPENIEYESVSYSVKSIEKGAFYFCDITSITIPKSVISIGRNAFGSCWCLESVHISDLEAWCKTLFDGYESNPLTSAHHLFLNGEEIQDLDIPNNVTIISAFSFSGCSSLISVNIHNNATRIEKSAFAECSSLTSVTIGNSLTSIGENAFGECSNLTSVNIPNSVTSIGERAFYYCSALNSITIPNGLTDIGKEAFYNCSSLTSISIPNSVTSIGESLFGGCSSLTSVIIPNSVTSIERNAFYGCTSLTSITIPNSVTNIGLEAFSSCI